ncbi:MAG TPA: hypothetical protein V6D18_07455 [Thermosynechococcaceae cyanobacterium]
MMTLLACPKPFRGHINTIQRNAIQSWLQLQPRPEIILFGDEEGTAALVDELGLIHRPNVDRTEQGTPLLSSIFQQGLEEGRGSLFTFINSDIVLMSDFTAAVQQVTFERFLLMGRRCDLNVEQALDFSQPHWATQLRGKAEAEGFLQSASAMDYFVFPRSLYKNVPPLAVGRVYIDNWLCYEAIRSDVPVIDATEAVLAVHQNHNYEHFSGGFSAMWTSPEGIANRKILGHDEHAYFRIDCANWVLTSAGLQQPQWTKGRLERCVEMLPYVRPELQSWSALLKHLMETRFHSNLEDGQIAEILQGLGEAFFKQANHWFWFSLKSENAQPVLALTAPSERDQIQQMAEEQHRVHWELNKLRQIIDTLEAKDCQAQAEIQRLHTQIHAIQSSKFWKLKTVWNRLKKRLPLTKH